MRVFIIALVSVLLLVSCEEGIQGNGTVVEQEYAFENFKEVSVEGGYSIEIVQGNTEKIVLTMDENLMQEVFLTQTEGKVHIENKRRLITKSTRSLTIYCKDLTALTVEGASEIHTENKELNFNVFTVDISGAASIELPLQANQLNFNIKGGAEVNLEGTTQSLAIEVAGASEINTLELQAKDVEIDLAGAGSVKVWATNNLDIHTTGAASIEYKGTPKITQKNFGPIEIISLDTAETIQ